MCGGWVSTHTQTITLSSRWNRSRMYFQAIVWTKSVLFKMLAKVFSWKRIFVLLLWRNLESQMEVHWFVPTSPGGFESKLYKFYQHVLCSLSFVDVNENISTSGMFVIICKYRLVSMGISIVTACVKPKNWHKIRRKKNDYFQFYRYFIFLRNHGQTLQNR